MLDAFTAGVAPGGLISSQHVRQMVCYLLSTLKQPIPKDKILEVLINEEIANYFEVIQAIGDLADNGSIIHVEGEGELYTVSEKGKEAIDELYKNLPFTVREKAIKAGLKMLAKMRSKAQNKVEMEQTDIGVNVTCSVIDGDHPILTVSLLVPDMEQAELVKETFHENTLKIYSGSIALLTGDYKSVKEQFEAE